MNEPKRPFGKPPPRANTAPRTAGNATANSKNADAKKRRRPATPKLPAAENRAQQPARPPRPNPFSDAPPVETRGMVAVQIVASEVVGRVLLGKNLDRELAASLTRHTNLNASEKQAVHSIAFDTLRHYGLFAAQLDTLLSQPLSDLPVRHLLLVALAQLQFSKAASHAVVDHAVNAAEAMGMGRAKGLANAVLRNFLRAPEKFKRERFKDAVAKYDFPRWWIERIQAEQPVAWENVLLSARMRPPMQLRVNRRKTNVEAYLAELAAVGQSATAVGGANNSAIALTQAVSVSVLPKFAEGWVSVQDLGAQYAAQFIDVQDGMRVLDACAAPGGKTAHMLETAAVELTALDTDKFRIGRISDTLTRLKLNATVKLADATKPETWWDKKPFDRIVVDAPCSGSGVVRRHPDIKWIRRETDLKRFHEVQLGLITACWKMLKPGGKLLYITCSIFNIENDDVINAFLQAESGAKRLPLSNAKNTMPADMNDDGPHRGQLLPDEQHDGFYYALLEKHR